MIDCCAELSILRTVVAWGSILEVYLMWPDDQQASFEPIKIPDFDNKTSAEFNADVRYLRERLLSYNDDVFLKVLLDTRSLHRYLFSRFETGSRRLFAGIYRGEPRSHLSSYEVHVKSQLLPDNPDPIVRRMVSAQLVSKELEKLSRFISETVTLNISQEEYYLRVVSSFARFLKIHPFADGNGRVARFQIDCLMRRRGLWVSPLWTIHPRPYDQALVFCLYAYDQYPDVLHFYMKKWFRLNQRKEEENG